MMVASQKMSDGRTEHNVFGGGRGGGANDGNVMPTTGHHLLCVRGRSSLGCVYIYIIDFRVLIQTAAVVFLLWLLLLILTPAHG